MGSFRTSRAIGMPLHAPRQPKPLTQIGSIPPGLRLAALDWQLCPTCTKASKVNIRGVETREHEVEIGPDRYRMIPHKSREPGMGILLHQSESVGSDLLIYGDTRLFMCNEKAKAYIQSKEWTNIEFPNTAK